MKTLIVLIFLLFSVNSFSKTVLIPRPFMSPEVTLLQVDAENIPLENNTKFPYHGARSKEKAINVTLNDSYKTNDVISFKLGGTNRGPWNRYVNVAILLEDDEKIVFPIYKSDLVGKGLSNSKIDVWVKLNKICEAKNCDFKNGVTLYFFLDDFLLREIKPIYEWPHIIGVYYTLKLQG